MLHFGHNLEPHEDGSSDHLRESHDGHPKHIPIAPKVSQFPVDGQTLLGREQSVVVFDVTVQSPVVVLSCQSFAKSSITISGTHKLDRSFFTTQSPGDPHRINSAMSMSWLLVVQTLSMQNSARARAVPRPKQP